MGKQIINFKSLSKYHFDVQTRPYPASESVPDWWKNMTPFVKEFNNPEGKKLIMKNNVPNLTFKKCTPMLDALTSGYIIPLWTDVFVSWERGSPIIQWKNSLPVFEPHGITSAEIPPPLGYSNKVLKYLNGWIPETPKGYSCMITKPFGYNKTPFHAVPAVLDTDSSTLDLPFPMWIKEGFEGIIEKGTPLVQITPFKRTDWESTFDYYEDGEHSKVQERHFNSTIVGNYIKRHWSKKTYK